MFKIKLLQNAIFKFGIYKSLGVFISLLYVPLIFNGISIYLCLINFLYFGFVFFFYKIRGFENFAYMFMPSAMHFLCNLKVSNHMEYSAFVNNYFYSAIAGFFVFLIVKVFKR